MASRSQRRPGASKADGPGCVLDTTAVVLTCSFIALLFARYAPHAYMDEPFHVLQTQQYCRGEFIAWDPKITTFPGLYMLGTLYARIASCFMAAIHPKPLELACSTVGLRTLNILLVAAFYHISCKLYRRLHPGCDLQYASSMALLMTLMPTHFFYAFLYYTDVASTTFVLAAYLACLNRQYHTSAALAAGGVLMRQTNAVWACLILATAAMQFCLPQPEHMRDMSLEEQALRLLLVAWQSKWVLLRQLWTLALVPAAFAIFVAANGGIVVGDKANHTPVLHLMQPLYLMLFCLGMLLPVELSQVRLQSATLALRCHLHTRLRTTLSALATACVLMAYVVQNFTLVHPFLLADNRHYTFYMWKDFFAVHPAAKFTLIPAYIYSAWALRGSLRGGPQSPLWQLLGALCAVATLVPAWLVEFRYFTIPFMMLVLHMQPLHRSALLPTLVLYVVVNVVTIYMFLFRTFHAVDGSRGRFMW